MFVTLLLSLLIQAGLFVLGCLIWQELRGARTALEKFPRPPYTLRPVPMTKFAFRTYRTRTSRHTFFSRCPPVFAIWAWRGTCWELELGTVPPGYEPVSPPTFKGSFHGQRVKTECQPC